MENLQMMATLLDEMNSWRQAQEKLGVKGKLKAKGMRKAINMVVSLAGRIEMEAESKIVAKHNCPMYKPADTDEGMCLGMQDTNLAHEQCKSCSLFMR